MNDYELMKQIGKGSSGQIFLSRHVKTNKRVVVKVISLVSLSVKER